MNHSLFTVFSYKEYRCYLRWLQGSNIPFSQLFFNELVYLSSWQQIYLPLLQHKHFLHLYHMILQLFHWHSFTYFLSKDMNLFVEPLRNQFLTLFFELCYFFFFIQNFPLLCHLIYFYCLLLFWFFLLFPFLLFLLLLLFPFIPFFFILFFLFLFLLLQFSLLMSSLFFTLLWTPCYLYFSCSPINLRIVISKL